MAIRGRRPKPEGQARHRNRLTHEWTDVENVPYADAPKLPRRCNGRSWPARTRAKWKAVSTMPHCALWRPPDWQFAFDAMEIAARLHEGEVRLAAELRAWERVLGTTADARAGQRIRYVDPVGGPAVVDSGVVDMADYRNL